MANTLGVNCHPSHSGLPQECILSDFWIDSVELYLSPEMLLNVLSKLYIPLCGVIFQIYGVKITGKVFASQKLKLDNFTHASPLVKTISHVIWERGMNKIV